MRSWQLLWLEEWYLHLQSHFVQHSSRIVLQRVKEKSGVVNYIMGLSFITEGAIPFAAGDPIHILPPCIVGSAVAGALSMAFKCGLPAPHGGIFVIGVITNPVQYLISVVVGAVIGMIVMSFTKKPLNK
mgnify:CR=1 FL=1